MNMDIKIFVFNHLTHETVIDSTITVSGDFATVEANHQVFREIHPDCQVNFVIDKDNFIFAPPINQEKDEAANYEGRITWEEYMNKWHRGPALKSDSNMSDYEDMAHTAFYSQYL
jgi:hypothetical protein